nr:MAG TPA: hypothetical protein [Caudoviricetes sp.]DAV90658.1 MAG TPA: hypothetical protein [Caudoviricetes sp.]DAX86632.1 MAG TPA: hypothetical protein [Caudoviricetes sp.]
MFLVMFDGIISLHNSSGLSSLLLIGVERL